MHSIGLPRCRAANARQCFFGGSRIQGNASGLCRAMFTQWPASGWKMESDFIPQGHSVILMF